MLADRIRSSGSDVIRVSVVAQGQIIAGTTDLSIFGVSFGAPHADRTIAVSVVSFDPTTNARTWNSSNAQIDGSAATTLVNQAVDGDDQIITAIMARAVPFGSTGSIRLSYSGGTVLGHDYVIYRVIGLSGLSTTDTETDTDNPGTEANLDLNTPAGGVLFANSGFYSTSSIAWTGATEVRDFSNGTTRAGHAYAFPTSTAAPLTLTATSASALLAGCSVSLTF